jgi:hypothetical protein
MPGLDDISRAIGALQEAADTASREREKLFDKLEQIAERLAPLPALVDRVRNHDQQLEELQTAKNRGIGWLAGAAAGGGGLGAVLVKWFGSAGH